MNDSPTMVASVRVSVTDMATVVRFFHSQNIVIDTKGKAISKAFKIFAESLPEFTVSSCSEAVRILTKLRCDNGLEKSNRLSKRLRKYLQMEQKGEQIQGDLVQIADQIMKESALVNGDGEGEGEIRSLNTLPTHDELNQDIADISVLAEDERTNKDLTKVPGNDIDYRNALLNNTPKVKE